MIFYNTKKITNYTNVCSVHSLLEMVDLKDISSKISSPWDTQRELDFCHSLFSYPQQPIFVTRNIKNQWIVLDGLNRIVALYNFINSKLSDASVSVFKNNAIIKKPFCFNGLSPTSQEYFLSKLKISIVEVQLNLEPGEDSQFSEEIFLNIMNYLNDFKFSDTRGNFHSRLKG